MSMDNEIKIKGANKLFNIVFDDGNIRMLVATEMESKDECNKIINRQEKPECYKILEMYK